MTIYDPLHEPIADGVRWTTRNVGEAIPGIPTPLTWSLWGDAINEGSRTLYRSLGLYSAAELAAQEAHGTATITISHGRPVAVIDTFSVAMSRVPGMSPAKFELDFFGIDSDEGTPRPERRGWLRVLRNAPVALAGHRGRVDAFVAESRQWWQSAVSRDMTTAQARAVIPDALDRFRHAMFLQSLQAAVAQSSYQAVAKLAARAGHVGLETQLLCATSDMEEAKIADGLWDIGRGRLSVAEFVAHHGYHGPDAGELVSRSWREAPNLVVDAAAAYQTMPEESSPAARRRARRNDKSAAVKLVHDGLSPALRPVFDAALRSASRAEARREAVKAAFLRVLDVLRLAIRCTADDFVQRGLLESADDIVYLTFEEIAAGRPPAAASDIVRFRMQQRKRYQDIELSGYGVGEPSPITVTTSVAIVGETVSGLPVSSGIATGIARVVTDAAECTQPLSAQEILVARTTDPGWVALFMGAAGLVVDVGGPLSHAAIIARALGIPCVINTIDGTKRITNGAEIRVDGATGQVSILGEGNPVEATISAPSETPTSVADEYVAEILPILHVLIVKGMASADVICQSTGLEPAAVQEMLEIAARDGLVKLRKGRLAGWILSPSGRHVHAAMLAKHMAELGCRPQTETAYAAFLTLNQPFKEICTAWQMRPDITGAGQINDHSDPEYDTVVIDRLREFHTAALAMTAEFPAELPHLSGYAGRLESAWQRLDSGEKSAFADPLTDSYHDVWMELHQDLMTTLGRERSSADGH
ncbi:PEP-utilizing enzyme [Mycolicibacterium helvum]|uniref:PEP-utilising enzyme mobile domain-containing protein n=1 Tax=Mycolicibacterium helvum TaxID=1534349 RepID=A0A7I7T2D5_9MYCO|nr:PEP-utilizing enzyme [Mycolicibacterium helvum]BBY62691.1 hypothetical protein MHEL_09340 [Mycolicibacterium helvum]